jgi:hypothetical protein
MFAAPGKVPGSASLFRASETGRVSGGRTQSRSTTPESSNHSDDNNSDDLGSQAGGKARSFDYYNLIVIVPWRRPREIGLVWLWGKLEKNSMFKFFCKFTKCFSKWLSFSGANWESKFTRVSRDLWPRFLEILMLKF